MRERHLLGAVAVIAAMVVGILTLISPDDPAEPADITQLADGGDSTRATEEMAGPALTQIAPWQVNTSMEVAAERFTKAEATDDRCTRLAALSSLPDPRQLPSFTQAELSGYLTRWFALADRTTPQLDDSLATDLAGARAVYESAEDLAAANDGTLTEATVTQLLYGETGDITGLFQFSAATAQQCPPPAE